jgi:hypothetical protein
MPAVAEYSELPRRDHRRCRSVTKSPAENVNAKNLGRTSRVRRRLPRIPQPRGALCNVELDELPGLKDSSVPSHERLIGYRNGRVKTSATVTVVTAKRRRP